MQPERPELASTGVPGLDYVLRGGLPRGKSYVVEGGPGTGKTTLGLQFLLEGVRAGERALFLTIAQSAEDLQLIARSHGWSLDGIDVHEVAPSSPEGRQTVFHSADVELHEVAGALHAAVVERRPERVVFDSFNALRVLAGEHQDRYREEIISLLAAVREADVTALFLGTVSTHQSDVDVESLAHGTVELTSDTAPYGADRRGLRVRKVRGLDYLTGQHDFAIRRGGLEVFPRLQTPDEPSPREHDVIPSGVPGLDALLGGGLQANTSCLVIGGAGTGKSTVATTFVHAALQRGEGAAMFLFDERAQTFLARSEGVGTDVRPFLESGLLHLRGVDPGNLTPGEFAQAVRRAVEGGARVVVIDSLTGYFHAMPDEQLLVVQMHELLGYLSQRGVLCLLVATDDLLMGGTNVVDVSYLADTVLRLRYFEAAGRTRVAVSAVKKRYGDHEKTLRELRMTGSGLEVGEPLEEFEGVLERKPTFVGRPERLLGGAGPGRDGQ